MLAERLVDREDLGGEFTAGSLARTRNLFYFSVQFKQLYGDLNRFYILKHNCSHLSNMLYCNVVHFKLMCNARVAFPRMQISDLWQNACSGGKAQTWLLEDTMLPTHPKPIDLYLNAGHSFFSVITH